MSILRTPGYPAPEIACMMAIEVWLIGQSFAYPSEKPLRRIVEEEKYDQEGLK
jgi:hypothetical protein